MKYLVVGGGAMGSVIAAYMARAGKDVTLLTRGKHLETIRANGALEVHYAPDDKTDQVPVAVASEEEYDEKPDVVIIATKAYSLESIYPLLDRISTPETVILPLMNALTIGNEIADAMTQPATVAQGVAYVACELVAPGRCKHKEAFFRIVLGARPGGPAIELAPAIRQDLEDMGATAEIAEDMLQAALLKFARVSVGSAGMVYFRASNAEILDDPVKFEFSQTLTREIIAVAEAAGCPFPADFDVLAENLKLARSIDPNYKTSLMYDFLAGKPTEWRTMFLEPYRLGRSLGVPMTNYGKVVEVFDPTATSADA
ncbi:2-dehydropantoate 2-reductase [Nocardioides ginsengisoli]|uniref:2-dehydropantoate 2-reductase n=2 Tax=Nocardioides TaxID=1839 RepID=A0A852RVV7_9ACTN|nr:2-dehydropantoate 2-reductase [Nocardioides kongjuensis]